MYHLEDSWFHGRGGYGTIRGERKSWLGGKVSARSVVKEVSIILSIATAPRMRTPFPYHALPSMGHHLGILYRVTAAAYGISDLQSLCGPYTRRGKVKEMTGLVT